ncbi:MAG: DNA-binding protein [Methylobacter sp.]|nr:MAG: DNA-binding protein [Methylobacter sp.]
MNNVTSITKAKRLTEEEVHAAAEELQSSGVKVSSIEVYRYLGRGSLTTITNFLKTWRQDDVVSALPAVLSLPDALSKAAEQLINKLWSESQALAEQEINSQREILKQAEALANEKIAEAEAFSEEQSKKIEALEYQIEAMSAELIEQQQANQTLISENTSLKIKLETIEQRSVELRNQFDKASESFLKIEAGSKKVEISNEVQRNQIDQLNQDLNNQREIVLSEQRENKALREKAARLEGELLAWKSIKPEKTSIAPTAKVKQPLKAQKKVSNENIPVSTPLVDSQNSEHTAS